ncbi:MAG: hypothetical protein OSJ70_04990 [Bacilli bacterium]|nr:hypothetical protein [Bacilli bacterium]
MANNTIEEFNECKITDAHVKKYDRKTGALSTDKSQRMGCTGKIEMSSEYKNIVKNCEGVETKSVKKLTKLTGNISLHMPLAIARSVYGLSNEGLKDGVYGLSSTASTPDMLFTAKVIDLFTEEEKLICLPKMSITSGFVKQIDNTSEEVAEVELEFNAYKDENDEFYYEALKSEIDEAITKDWMESFTPELVKATTE